MNSYSRNLAAHYFESPFEDRTEFPESDRTEFPEPAKDALVHPTKTKWAFVDNYLDVLESLLPPGGNEQPARVPLLDLVAWMFRDREQPASVDEAIRIFRDQFHPSNDEVSRLFDKWGQIGHPLIRVYESLVMSVALGDGYPLLRFSDSHESKSYRNS